MTEFTAHPSREQLSAYNLGQLPPDEAVAVESHISECEPCCNTIISLSSDDTFVGLLKEARQLPSEQTAAQTTVMASSPSHEVPVQLAEHPRYEIFGLIGKGGMGEVYKARHRKMERTVALKVINRGLVRKAEAIGRFHREVKAAAQLSHPNIVTAYDADQAGDYHFMVMEYVDGVDLSRTVKDRGALPITEACDYVRQAAIGLQHAHECGMVHRDIKPHNLMVTANGIVKILDFGLAALAPEGISDADQVVTRSDLTAAGAIMGTPDFISPEQAEDARQADIRSDIYSLGATLYYLLSARVPFADGSVMHKLRSHAQIEPDSLTTLREDVPCELVAIVSRMMAKDPGERYLTPREVADALESFLRDWQSGEIGLQQPALSNAGNRSGLGEQKASSGDAGRDWLLVVARTLFVLAWIPVALMGLELIARGDAPVVAAGQRTWSYMLIALCLSSIAGIVFALRKLNSGFRPFNPGDRRNFRVTASEFLFVAALFAALMVAAAGYYLQNSGNVLRVEQQPAEDKTTLGTHSLTIIDTSGRKPFGGTSGTRQDDAAGTTIHFFESANGRYKLELSNEILTVNGESYTLKNPTDLIRIVDDRVEITQLDARPDPSNAMQGQQTAGERVARNQPATNLTNSPSDQAAMQGEWRVIFAEDGGRTGPPEALRDVRLVITEDKLSMEVGGQTTVSTFKLDPSTTPKSIDLTTNGRTKPGIYDLQGDTLRICTSERTDDRPTAFDSQPDSVNDLVLTLKRVRPDTEPAAEREALNHDGPLSEGLARLLLPEAASISNDDFQTLQSNPAGIAIENETLSFVLLLTDARNPSPEAASEFGFLVEGAPKPRDIAAAMSQSRSKGYYSLIQPDYITECKITAATDETAQGKVAFNAPQLYIGSVLFEARKHKGKWTIEKFWLPSRKLSIELGEDGKWHRKVESLGPSASTKSD